MSKYTDYGFDILEFERDAQTGNPKFVVLLPIIWEFGKKGSNYIFTVPAGFIFDVSIPKIATIFFDPTDIKYLKAAALHDCLLENKYDWVFSAAAFNEALRADRVGFFKRTIMFFSVLLWKYE